MSTTRLSIPFGLFFAESAPEGRRFDVTPIYDETTGLSFVEHDGQRFLYIEYTDMVATATETKIVAETTDADPSQGPIKVPVRTATLTRVRSEDTDSDYEDSLAAIGYSQSLMRTQTLTKSEKENTDID